MAQDVRSVASEASGWHRKSGVFTESHWSLCRLGRMRKAGSGVREDGGGGGDSGEQQPSSTSPRREGKQAQGKHFSLRPPHSRGCHI